MHRSALVVLSAALLVAGCTAPSEAPGPLPAPAADGPGLTVVDDLLNDTLARLPAMAFNESVVTAGVDFTGDLYEPTMEACADGSIYITAHTILVDTTGAPVFGSHDDGATWEQLPWLQSVRLPEPVQGATPPPSDEIFLACGDDGWLYGGDITLATFPVNGWSGDGTTHAYHNPNAYDEAQASQAANTERGCVPAPAKDRPWVAYSNGKLLMVSNPASGPAQVGVLDVPPLLPASVGATVGGASWNLCAGPGTTPASCSIPGIPDVRADGAFVVPQRCQGVLHLVSGNVADIQATSTIELFEHTSQGEITSVYGIAAYDANGTLFVGITNNTANDDPKLEEGRMRFAVSVDGGLTYADRSFSTGVGKPARHFYMDANDFGPGALVVWAVDGERDEAGQGDGYDWYVGHLQNGADGLPELTGVFLAIDEGPQPSAHVTGAAVGPDGRAYLTMYTGGASLGGQATPLSVYVQTAGPALPVTPTAQ